MRTMRRGQRIGFTLVELLTECYNKCPRKKRIAIAL